jgi:hypothetical protein
MRYLLYHEYEDEDGQKWLVNIRNRFERQFEFANDKIVTSLTGNGGIIVRVRNLFIWGLSIFLRDDLI